MVVRIDNLPCRMPLLAACDDFGDLLPLKAGRFSLGPVGQVRDQHQEAFLYSGRIVPIKRESNIVYARTLRRGDEEDTGEVVDLQPGDRLVIPKGEFQVDSRDIDEHFNPKGLGGYRPVANTVWSCDP